MIDGVEAKMTTAVEESNLQKAATMEERELQRLSFGIRYEVPGRFQFWDMPKDNWRNPPYPRDIDVVGTYDIYYYRSNQSVGLLARTVGSKEGVTNGTMQLSVSKMRGRITSESGIRELGTVARSLRTTSRLEGKLFFDTLNEEHTVSTFEAGSYGRGSISIRYRPMNDRSLYADGSLYIVRHRCAFAVFSKTSDQWKELSLDHGQELLDRYKDGIAMTMHLNLPVEVAMLVRDFIGPPPVLFVEPGDVVLSFQTQTLLARPRREKHSPPSVLTTLKSSCCLM